MRLIDADALFINLDGMMAVSPTGYIHGETVADMISDAPTVDAVPVVHGKWLPENRTMDYFWVCSVCKFPSEAHGAFKLYKYCPNCGAYMRGE